MKIGHIKIGAADCLRLMPVSWRRAIRRRYYEKVLRAYDVSDWEWSPVVMPLIRTGGQVIDVGANVGYLSRLFAEQVGDNGRVVSIEPIPDTFDSLRHNMKRMYAGRVTALSCCVSDRPGQIRMAVPRYRDGGENFYESHIVTASSTADENGRVFEVEARTLDDIVSDLSLEPCFIKIDVEGHELAVINGATRFLSAKKPPLLIEVAGDPDEQASPAAELFRRLAAFGYRAFTRDGRACRPRQRGDVEVDYLFMTQGADT